MAEYQKVEVATGQEDGGKAFSEEDVEYLEKAVEEGQEAEAAEERPAWLPEKFQSAEDMATAYSELEAQFTSSKQSAAKGEEPTEEAAAAPQPMGLETYSQYTSEFADTGDISEESRIELVESIGVPREMIDAYVEGQKALLGQYYSDVHATVGGEANYEEMLRWAGETLPEAEQNVFNEAVVNGTRDQMMFAVKGLATQWTSQTGSSPTSKPLIQGSTGFEGASSGFRSLAELTAAMKDPRYSKDPAYRKDIESRLGNSSIL